LKIENVSVVQLTLSSLELFLLGKGKNTVFAVKNVVEHSIEVFPMGSKTSGNPYMFSVIPDAELGQFINYLTSKTGKARGTWVMSLILEAYEKEARAYFRDVLKNEGLYEEFVKKHSLTVYEQRTNKIKRKEEDIEKQEEFIRIEKEKLELAKEKEKRLREEFEIQKDNQIEVEPEKPLESSEMSNFLLWLKGNQNLTLVEYKSLTSAEKTELRREFRK